MSLNATVLWLTLSVTGISGYQFDETQDRKAPILQRLTVGFSPRIAQECNFYSHAICHE
jgi:hypothetical protein